MTAAAKSQPKTSVAISREMEAARRRAQRRLLLGKSFTYLVGVVIALWILLPIYFIASMGLTTQETVRSFPKGVLPFIPFSFDTMAFFLGAEGIISGVINSVSATDSSGDLSTTIERS